MMIQPSTIELQTLVAQISNYINNRPIGVIHSTSTDSYQSIDHITLIQGYKNSFITSYKARSGVTVPELPTVHQLETRRFLLDKQLTRMWVIWMESYIKEQNTVTSSLGATTPIKLGGVVLINNLELGMGRGRYTTGLIE